MSRWLAKPEIDGLVARAPNIVRFFDREVAAKGEGTVLYDFPRSPQACGVGTVAACDVFRLSNEKIQREEL